MADLEIGEKVEFLKSPPNCGIDIKGYPGVVERKVSGGWMITLNNAFIGKFEVVIGSIDWPEFVKRLVIKDPTPSPVPRSLNKWYSETAKTIKRG